MKVKNWDRFQHFKDRRPIWIKLYRELLDDFEINSLSCEAFKFLIQIWLIASDDPKMEGNIPSPEAIAFRLRINKNKCLDLMRQIDIFLILDESQSDISHALAREETEKETEKRREEETPAARHDIAGFIETIRTNPAYKHVNFEVEIGKIEAWKKIPKNKNRQITKRFVLNWLNRIEAPLEFSKSRGEDVNCNFPGCKSIWTTRRDGKALCRYHAEDAQIRIEIQSASDPPDREKIRAELQS